MEGVWDGGTVGVHFPLTIYTEFGTSERGVNSNETSQVQGTYTTSRDCVIRSVTRVSITLILMVQCALRPPLLYNQNSSQEKGGFLIPLAKMLVLIRRNP